VKYSREVKVGLFAIISIAVFYWGFNYIKGIELLNTKSKYYVIYEDVAGLQVSNPVSISGFTVGRVSNIEILQRLNNQILVEIEINQDLIIGDSAIAFLDVGLLGSVSILLDVGDISNPLEDGDTIDSRVDQALEGLIKESTLVADNIQSMIRRINTILDGLIGNTDKISATLDNLEGTSNNLKRITGTGNQRRISDLLDNMNATVGDLRGSIKKIDPVLEKYGQLADSLKTIDVDPTLTKINETLDVLTNTLNKINEGQGTLGKLINEDSIYVQLIIALEDLDKLLIHMNENPKHFFGPLGQNRRKIERDLEKQNSDDN